MSLKEILYKWSQFCTIEASKTKNFSISENIQRANYTAQALQQLG